MVTAEDDARMRELRDRDLSFAAIGRIMGISERAAWMRFNNVPARRCERLAVAPIREAVVNSPLSNGEVARRLGWENTRLRRALGMAPTVNGEGRRSVRSTIAYDTAVAICRALDLAPVDLGL